MFGLDAQVVGAAIESQRLSDDAGLDADGWCTVCRCIQRRAAGSVFVVRYAALERPMSDEPGGRRRGRGGCFAFGLWPELPNRQPTGQQQPRRGQHFC